MSAHASAIVETVFVLAQVVPLPTARVREDGVGLGYEFELLLIATLGVWIKKHINGE
jgi:hypothetical protein